MYIVTLKIGGGDFERGFFASLSIDREGCPTELEINAQLPPAPHIPQQYSLWQASYLGLN